MKKIGILCASDTELAPFLSAMQSVQTTKKAMLTFYAGCIGKVDVVAAYSGVCKVNAAIAAQLMVDFFQVDVIINGGVAGGIDKSVALFDTIVSQGVAYHDVAEDILTEFHPWLEDNYFHADKELVAIAKEYSQTATFPILFGTMVTGEQFIEDEKREEIEQKYGALSVDMETAGIAHVCHVNQIPFLSVRTITDTAAHKGMENFEKNCEKASKISAEIVMGMIQDFVGKMV